MPQNGTQKLVQHKLVMLISNKVSLNHCIQQQMYVMYGNACKSQL